MPDITKGQNEVLIQRPALEMLDEITEYVESVFETCGVPVGCIMKMNIALDEIYSNIVKFSEASFARITCGVENGRTAYVIFTDDGKPYDPLASPEPDVTLPAEKRADGGLGFYIVKKIMSEITYESVCGNNKLTLKLNF